MLKAIHGTEAGLNKAKKKKENDVYSERKIKNSDRSKKNYSLLTYVAFATIFTDQVSPWVSNNDLLVQVLSLMFKSPNPSVEINSGAHIEVFYLVYILSF